MTEVICPSHDMPRGVPCPRPAWPFCAVRKAKLVKVAAQLAARGRVRANGEQDGTVRIVSADWAQAREIRWADREPEPCFECWAEMAWQADMGERDRTEQGRWLAFLEFCGTGEISPS